MFVRVSSGLSSFLPLLKHAPGGDLESLSVCECVKADRKWSPGETDSVVLWLSDHCVTSQSQSEHQHRPPDW